MQLSAGWNRAINASSEHQQVLEKCNVQPDSPGQVSQ
jgi:hypothetical protein